MRFNIHPKLINLFAFLFFTSLLNAQNFNLVKDINDSKDANPYNYTIEGTGKIPFAVLNNVAYFMANDGTHGTELWRTDGTSAGTYIVKDINPLGDGGFFFSNITVSNDLIFFDGTDGTHGFELWKSDGTEAGTVMVKDIYQGSNGSAPFNVIDVNGTLFFSANDGVSGNEIWKSDGTEQGTTLVKDFVPGMNNSNIPFYLTSVNGLLYFVINEFGSSSNGVWSTDGTEAGSKHLITSDYCGLLHNLNGKVFFSNWDYIHGEELWITDGSTTKMVKDIVEGSVGSSPNNFIDYNGVLYFAAGGYGYLDRELWRSDGTDVGTYEVKDVYTGTSSGSSPRSLTATKDFFYFVADSETGTGIWKSDGTNSGTTLLKNFTPALIDNLTSKGDQLYFSSFTDSTGHELWKTDGTSAGTFQVKDIFTGISSSYPAYITPFKKGLLFAATNNKKGIELWKSDGTKSGTVLVKNINTTTTSSSFPIGFNSFKNKAYFVAKTNANGMEPWESDGTESGTTILKDIQPGSIGSEDEMHSFSPFVKTASTLFFVANTLDYGREIWKSDGTSQGTQLLKDITPGSSSTDFDSDIADQSELHTSSDKLYFAISKLPFNGNRYLWVSDGTANGTTELGLLNNVSVTSDFTPTSKLMFFRCNLFSGHSSLWRTNGTYSQTFQVSKLEPKTNSFFSDSNLVYFNTIDNSFWRSDGSGPGTVHLKNNLQIIRTTDMYKYPTPVIDGVTYFVGNNGVSGNELWATDGTRTGTHIIKDINPGTNNGIYPYNIVVLNKTLFFIGNDPDHGTELWKSDGTRSGTRMVKDIVPGTVSSSFSNLVIASGKLYFVVLDTSTGVSKLWQSDGSRAGTIPVKDDNLKNLSMSVFPNILAVENKIYFNAATSDKGSELGCGIVENNLSANRDTERNIEKSTGNNISISLHPNPVYSSFELVIDNNTQTKHTIQLSIRDVQGKSILSENKVINTGNNFLIYNCSNWAAGAYILKVVFSNGTTKELKVIKLKI